MRLPAAGSPVESDPAILGATRPWASAALLNGVGEVIGVDGVIIRIGMTKFDPNPVSPREGGISSWKWKGRWDFSVFKWEKLASYRAWGLCVNLHDHGAQYLIGSFLLLFFLLQLLLLLLRSRTTGIGSRSHPFPFVIIPVSLDGGLGRGTGFGFIPLPHIRAVVQIPHFFFFFFCCWFCAWSIVFEASSHILNTLNALNTLTTHTHTHTHTLFCFVWEMKFINRRKEERKEGRREGGKEGIKMC